MNYRDLEIWKLARDLTARIHCMTLEQLPEFEMYEEGSQIRRSMKSVRSNIVEGFGRRRYKQEFIRFLTAHTPLAMKPSIISRPFWKPVL